MSGAYTYLSSKINFNKKLFKKVETINHSSEYLECWVELIRVPLNAYEVNTDYLAVVTVLRYYSSVISSFGDSKTEKLYRIGEYKVLDKIGLKVRALILLDIMEAVESLDDLRIEAFPPDIRLHKLKGDLQGFWAIDINKLKGFRIIFMFENNKFEYVKITDYH